MVEGESFPREEKIKWRLESFPGSTRGGAGVRQRIHRPFYYKIIILLARNHHFKVEKSIRCTNAPGWSLRFLVPVETYVAGDGGVGAVVLVSQHHHFSAEESSFSIEESSLFIEESSFYVKSERRWGGAPGWRRQGGCAAKSNVFYYKIQAFNKKSKHFNTKPKQFNVKSTLSPACMPRSAPVRQIDPISRKKSRKIVKINR